MHCMTCDDVYPFPCFHSLHDSSVRLASERVSDITQFRIFLYPASSEVVITVEQVLVSYTTYVPMLSIGQETSTLDLAWSDLGRV